MTPDLAVACPVDGRPVGEHTLHEWWDEAHRAAHTDLPYEEVPDGPVEMTVDALMADQISVRSGIQTYELTSGASLVVPILVFDFSIGRLNGPPELQTSVAYLATPEVMRKTGVILRDTANGAANAAERAR